MSVVAFALLLAATLVWVALPLIPAFRELWWPTDVEPLSVVGRDAGDVAFFARGFRRYLHSQLEEWRLAGGTGRAPQGTLPDGTPVLRLPGVADRPEAAESGSGLTVDAVAWAEEGAELAGGATYLREVYATGGLRSGPGVTCRAVLCEGRLQLGDDSTVLRWAHGGKGFEAAAGCRLYGRASSEGVLRLAPGVRFERLAAPRIVVGEGDGGSAAPVSGPPEPFDPPFAQRTAGRHRWWRGTLKVPERRRVDGNLITSGAFELGSHGAVCGSVKAGRDVRLGIGSRVEGGVVARRSVEIGAECRVDGPVVAEESIVVGAGAVVGTAANPTTLTAPRVTLHRGAVVHGAVAAQVSGRTEEAPARPAP